MEQLPTIKDIAFDLYYAEGIDFTVERDQAVDQDDREGFDRVVIDETMVRYARGERALWVQAVIGIGEDLGETTLDYLWSVEVEDGYIDQGGTDDPRELVEVIKNFMA